MHKTDLSRVTLIVIDDVDPDIALKVITECQRWCDFGQIRLFTSQSADSPYTVKITPIDSLEAYGHFVIKQLYQFVVTSHVLIAQKDGFIANPYEWSPEFLEYDYIGASWPLGDPKRPKSNRIDRCVGNGGFSLRSKKLLDACADINVASYFQEDLVICVQKREFLEQRGCVFAPKEIADQFSAESWRVVIVYM